VDRAPTMCSGGCGFDSCRGLRYFLCPTLVSCWIIHLSQDTTLFCHMLMVRGKCARLLNFNDVCFIGIEHDIVQINYRFLYSCLYFLSFCLVLQEWKTSLTLTDSSHRKMRCNSYKLLSWSSPRWNKSRCVFNEKRENKLDIHSV